MEQKELHQPKYLTLTTVIVALAYFLAVWIPFNNGKGLSGIFGLNSDTIQPLLIILVMLAIAVVPIVLVYFVVLWSILKQPKHNLSLKASLVFYFINLNWWLLSAFLYSLLNFDSAEPYHRHEIIIVMPFILPIGMVIIGCLGIILNLLLFFGYRNYFNKSIS